MNIRVFEIIHIVSLMNIRELEISFQMEYFKGTSSFISKLLLLFGKNC